VALVLLTPLLNVLHYPECAALTHSGIEYIARMVVRAHVDNKSFVLNETISSFPLYLAALDGKNKNCLKVT